MNWSEMSKTFKLFNKKNFGKMDLRASKKKRQISSTSHRDSNFWNVTQ